MRPEQRDAAYLWDMLEAAREALSFTQEATRESYLESPLLQRAVERTIEIIGEAANRISPALREAHPEIPWRKIVAQRNVLAHEYGDIEQILLWDLIRDRLPVLVWQLEEIIPPEPREPEA